MLKFSLFRIPVSIHWMFLFLTAFLGGGLRAQTGEEIRGVMIFMVAAFISILVHEFGHALAGLKMGARRTEIELNGMGGLARFPEARFTRKQSILTAAAGPGASILLASVFIGITLLLSSRSPEAASISPELASFIDTMVFINLFWTFINLCPVMPLDGGQILRNALGPTREKLSGIIGLVTVVILAVLLWFATQSIYNLIIMALLASYNWKLIQQSQ